MNNWLRVTIKTKKYKTGKRKWNWPVFSVVSNVFLKSNCTIWLFVLLLLFFFLSWFLVLLIGCIRDISQLVEIKPAFHCCIWLLELMDCVTWKLKSLFVPVLCVFAVEIVNPIANSVLLIESCPRSAHVRNTAAILVAHVEQHALEFLIGVKSKRTTRAVEIKRHVRKLLPAFRL